MCKKKKKKKRINRAKFKVFRLEYTGRWTWRLEASNGKVYAKCASPYKNKGDCVIAVTAIQNMAGVCEIVEGRL